MEINNTNNINSKTTETRSTMGHIEKVTVSWAEKNYCCAWYNESAGTVVATGKTLESLKRSFEESLKLHISGCISDGDTLPDYLVNGDYELRYILDTAALLQDAGTYTTIAAISRATGINQKQLSHYANGLKIPRAAQIERIKNGLRSIGRHIIALS